MTEQQVPQRDSRGRSRPGRLDAVDAAIVTELGSWLAEADPAAPVVDLGFGAYPWTLRSLARAVRTVASRPVVGVEGSVRFAERAARVLDGEGISAVWGGFSLPPQAQGAALVRVMNVLRSYRAEEVGPALDALAEGVTEGGWIVEGSCSLDGDATATRWWQVAAGRRRLRAWGFGTTLSAGYAPALFMPRLPPDAKPDWFDDATLLGRLRMDWDAAFSEAVAAREVRARFDRTAWHLGRRRAGVWAARDACHGWLHVPWNGLVTGDAEVAVGG